MYKEQLERLLKALEGFDKMLVLDKDIDAVDPTMGIRYVVNENEQSAVTKTISAVKDIINMQGDRVLNALEETPELAEEENQTSEENEDVEEQS